MTHVCGLCKALNDLNNETIPLPILSKQLVVKVNNMLNNNNNDDVAKNILGIIKFTHKQKTYIHCPIESISNDGIIKFGICKHFETLENTFRNRQKLCTHKFRYHYNSNKLKSNLLILKVSKSIEEVLLDLNN
jgi:hypothetical protein